MIYRILLTVMIFLSPAFAAGAENSPITSRNWESHPAIQEIRDLYSEVKQLIDAKKLSQKKKEFENCEPYQDSARILYVDSKDIARNYYYDAGSDDSMVKWDFTYDKNGKLRFTFIKAGAVNGTMIEHRIYFDPSGKRIWEMQKLVEGPGYTFSHVPWPDDNIVYDPIKAFNEKNACKEITKSKEKDK